MKKKLGIIMLITACLITACAPKEKEKITQTEETQTQETTVKAETVLETEAPTIVDKEDFLNQITALLGMSDEEASSMLGGGTVNKTDDGTFLIGRVYQTMLFDEAVIVNTIYDDQDKVGVAQVVLKKNEADYYQAQLDKLLQTDAVTERAAESGSQISSWKKDGKLYSLYSNGEEISLEIIIA